MSNVIYIYIYIYIHKYILNQARWNPRTFDCWEDPSGAAWIIKDYKTSPDIVAAAISRSYLDGELHSAAQHYNGLGMQDGIDADNTLRYLRALKSDSNVEYGYKAMLETIMSGAMWPASRIVSIRPLYCDLCPRCGIETETPLHTFWTCPCNKQIDEPIIQNTDKYIQYAVQEESVYPCLWFRGILPKIFTDIDIPEPTNDLYVTHVNEDKAHWSSGIYYGDASGGQFTQYNKIRRIGVSFILSDDEGSAVHAAHFNLPGSVQTVTRGELFSLVVLIRFLEPLSRIEFVTDNFNVYRTFNGGPMAGVNSANCDLYEEVFKAIYDKALHVKLRWIPSHISEKIKCGKLKQIPEGVSPKDISANDKADEYAAIAAEQFKLPEIITTPYVFQVKRIKRIQKRLTTIALYLPKREYKKECIPTEEKVIINKNTALAETSHTLTCVNNRYKCSVCKNSFRRDDKGFKHWLTTQCIQPTQETDTFQHVPIKVNTQLHLGNNTVHSSHNIYDYRGIIYCNVCGARTGQDQMRYLGKQCTTPGPGGSALLLAISSNRLPPGIKTWPK